MYNKEKIKELVIEILNHSNKAMIDKIDRALNSGAIDTEDWSENHNPMILPKTIVTALLENEAKQYDGGGTCFAKEIKEGAKNLRYFI